MADEEEEEEEEEEYEEDENGNFESFFLFYFASGIYSLAFKVYLEYVYCIFSYT